MNIISKHFDYYDSSAYLYGSDDRLRYDRNDFLLSKMWLYDNRVWQDNQITQEVMFDLDLPRFDIIGTIKLGRYYRSQGSAHHFFMVICGKLYPVILWNTKTNSPASEHDTITSTDTDMSGYVSFGDCKWVVYDQVTHGKFFKDTCGSSFISKRDHMDLTDRFGVYDQKLVDLSRIVGSPCFIVTGQSRSNWDKFGVFATGVVNAIPVLSELGFDKVYPGHQLYQDIEYFIGNMLHNSPDVAPVGKPAQTNEEKIVASGFDLKTSFRGKTRISKRKQRN